MPNHGILVSLRAKDELAAENLLKAARAHFERQLSAEAGAVRCGILEPISREPTTVRLAEQWLTEADYAEHQRMPHLQEFKETIGTLLGQADPSSGGEALHIQEFGQVEHFSKGEEARGCGHGILVSLRAKDEEAAAKTVEALRGHFSRQLDLEPGATQCDIFLPRAAEPRTVWILEQWHTEADYTKHKETENLKHFLSIVGPLLDGDDALDLREYRKVEHFARQS